jgi:hypothetical protein
MVAVKEITWEEASAPGFEHTTRHAFRAAVDQVAANAKAALPESASRIDKAVQIVLQGDVELLPDGHAKVASQCHGTLVYRLVNGTCDCPDYGRAPSNWCKHRIAAGIQKRAMQAVQTPAEQALEPMEVSLPAVPAIAPEHIVELHGKRFVTFAGLLALAHTRGLTSLTADWTYNDVALSLAQAVAVFPFGTYTECGDATPDNVTKKVSPHFRRVALTRAKARALRDALNIDMVSLEELAE